MKAICNFFIFSLLVFWGHAINNPPEFKFAFSYDAIESIKYTALRPFVENITDPIYIDKTFAFPLLNILEMEIGNITISNFTLNWEKTHLLIPNAHHNPSIQLKGFSVRVMFDGRAGTKKMHFKGSNNTLDIIDLDLELNLAFGTHANLTVYAYIDTYQIQAKKVHLNFTNTFAHMIEWLVEELKIPFHEIERQVVKQAIKKLNTTLYEQSTQGLSLQYDDLNIQASLATKPEIFYLGIQAFQSLSVNAFVENNKKNSSAPVSPADLMPDYINNGLEIQAFISDNLIEQVLWSVFDIGIINLNISNADLPESVPIHLNTSLITVLLPNIMKEFGPNKGMYLQVQAADEIPLAFIRDGRLVVELSVLLDFWVDTDGSHYPDEGLINCTTCVKGVSLETKVLASVVLYRLNATNLGVRVINAQIVNIKLISGDVDPQSLATTLNNLLVSMLIQINLQLAPGIPNPLIGKFGINDMATKISTDYLFLGLNVESPVKSFIEKELSI